MEQDSATIPTASKAQAMDWSLVLASQEIGHAIVKDAETGRWGLEVERRDVARACTALRQYLRENRHWLLRPAATLSEFRYDKSAIICCAVLGAIHAVATTQMPDLVNAGEMHVAAFRSGEWWRLFTAVTLHADVAHLLTNLVTGLIIFGFAFARVGASVGLLASWLAGAAGNLLDAMIYPPASRALGASGMVLGALGLLTTQALADWRHDPTAPRRLIGSLSGGLMLFLLLGASPQSDLVGHLGGFLAGSLIGVLLVLTSQNVLRRRSVRMGVFAATIVLFVSTWFLAFREATE